MKGRTGDKHTDQRVKIRHFTWSQYAMTLVVFGSIAGLPAVLYGADIFGAPKPYFFWYLIYWAIVTGIFCVVTAYQKYRMYDKPISRLRDAARRVAEGDFSVYLEPAHPEERYDYIDVMFEDFNKMVRELGSLETMKSDFVANVSHEMKTPLSIILNYATALRNETLSAQTRGEYTDTIIESSQRLVSLVTNILRLNKIENQVIAQNRVSYDLCRQLCDCALSFEDLWEKKNITFTADMDDRAFIYADASLLEIVWHNLLSNALKFTNPGGTVTLTQSSDEKYVTVSVEDTGCGMDEETLKHVFDKFYQGDTSHTGEGNGLGLALSLRVVELSGGTLSVQSTLGHGSVFTVVLAAAV